MRKGIDGAYGRPEPFKGTHAYFSMQSTYLVIFFSRKLSNLERVRNAAFVVGIVRRWRCFVKRNKELTLKLIFFFKLNFVASQTYSHVLASCQVAVLQIKAVAHLNPHLATCLERTGSNYCEKAFSGLGGYGQIHSNHRDFNESDAVERLSNLLTLEKLEGGKTGLDFGGEARSTQRDIKIDLHEDQSLPDADLAVHFSDDEMVQAWVKGNEDSKAEAESLGMKLAEASAWWNEP